eukprot:TRINITY_DN9911_c0_g2_i1.p1 TRINITY_DN9911_c0_g2~~TRINITY_DN9911_c0_g2_i1.p1  ORF type:complete len:500 (-),score=59.91 TRINITY_DN9911_c0_g2_i1:41-1540(-)
MLTLVALRMAITANLVVDAADQHIWPSPASAVGAGGIGAGAGTGISGGASAGPTFIFRRPGEAAAGQAVVAASVPTLAPKAGAASRASALRVSVKKGGGAHCEFDFECGWINPLVSIQNRLETRAVNGARCLVGRCVCADEFDNKYGCARCNVPLAPQYSYSDDSFETSTRVRLRDSGHHIDLCDMPSSGHRCEVGICNRDEKNRTIFCPGDAFCNAAGVDAGICVGGEGSQGTCRCAEGYFCPDCSLHHTDLLQGLTCKAAVVTGGALCASHSHCSSQAFCDHLPEESALAKRVSGQLGERQAGQPAFLRPLCVCNSGFTCRRCERRVSDIRNGDARCICDEPVFSPNGGLFHQMQLDVNLAASPWDSVDYCDIRYMVERAHEVPSLPKWPTKEAADKALQDHGTRLRRTKHGKMPTVTLKYSRTLRNREPDADGFKSLDLFYIWAVTVPRNSSGESWDLSRVVRSKAFMLSTAARVAAVRRGGCVAAIAAFISSAYS